MEVEDGRNHWGHHDTNLNCFFQHSFSGEGGGSHGSGSGLHVLHQDSYPPGNCYFGGCSCLFHRHHLCTRNCFLPCPDCSSRSTGLVDVAHVAGAAVAAALAGAFVGFYKKIINKSILSFGRTHL